MWPLLLVISLVAGADSGALPSDVKQYLYDNGLECCVAQIMSKPSWWSAGTGKPVSHTRTSTAHTERYGTFW